MSACGGACPLDSLTGLGFAVIAGLG